MAETFQEKRRRELGLTPSSPSASDASETGSSSGSDKGNGKPLSFQEKRMMELGMVPDTRPQPTVQERVSSGALPSFNLADSPLMKQVDSFRQTPTAEAATETPQGGYEDGLHFTDNPIKYVFQKLPNLFGLPEEKTFNAVDRFSASLDASLTPKGPYLTSDPNKSLWDNMTDGTQYAEGPTAYERAIARRNATGNGGTADKIADVAGEMTSYVAPLPGMNPILNESYKGVNAIAKGTKIGQWAEQRLGQAGQKAADKLNPILNVQGINIGPRLAGNMAQQAGRGAAAGALFGATQPFVSGTGQMSELPGSILENSLMGAVGDGSMPLAGAGLKVLADKFAGSRVGDAISRFMGRESAAAPEVEQQVKEMLSQPQRLRVQLNPDQYLSSVMERIKPIVTENMTPPLENPNGLAKWVHNHLQNDMPNLSLNEVRKTPYEDLRQLAEEIRSSFSVHDEAVKAAKNLGYDLPALLDRKIPTVGERIAKDAQARSYGVYPESPVKLRQPEGLRADGFQERRRRELGITGSSVVGKGTMEPATMAGPDLTGKPMAEISQPNNPHTMLDALKKQDNNLGFSALGKKTSAYDNLSTSTKSQLVSKTGREPISPRQVVDSGYRKIVDDLYRFKDFDNHTERVLGRKLAPSEQSHTLALNSRGSDMITKHILTEDLVDINGNVIGRSLKNATQQIPKEKVVDFEDYQVLKHGMFRMKRGEKVYRDELEMTPDKAAQLVADYEKKYPEFKKIADELYLFRQNLGKTWIVDTGLLPRKIWDGYLENNPFYVPNNRQFSEVEKGVQGKAKRGFAGQTSPMKPAPGSQRKIISPIESDIEHVDQYVKAGKRNQVMQNVVKMVQKDPKAFEGFVELVSMTDNMKQSELKKLNEIIATDGVDGFVMNLNDQFDQMFNQAKAAGRKDFNNIIPVLLDGEPVWVKVNDAPFLEAVTNLTPQAQGVIVETARQATRIMKLLTTGVNPIFSLTRNLVRDIPMAYVASKTTNNPVRFAWDLLDSTVSILGNKDMYKSFKAVGGGHSSSIAADRNLLAQSKRDILPQRKLVNVPGKIISSVENFTNALETAPRLGEYKRTIQAGNNSPDSKIEGLFAANDVTVNFKRRGNVGREIDAFLPYFNAAIQGLDKTFRTFKDNPAAASLKAIAAITVPSIWLYSINHNDPDYQKLDNRTKDTYYLIPKGDGTFYKLPKPREGGVVFGSSVERALRLWKEQDPEAFRGFAETARVAFAPPGLSGLTKPGSFTDKLEGALIGDTITGPLSDLKSNKDFADRPIVPGYMDGLSPKLQYDQRTSELSKWIGNKINQSPKQLDYLLKSYTGIIGQVGIPLNSEGGDLKKALIQQVTADPTYSNSVFTDFYDMKERLDTAEKDFKQTGEKSPDYNEPARKYLNRISDNVSRVRKTMREVQADNKLGSDAKDKKLKELQILMTSIADDANKNFKKINR